MWGVGTYEKIKVIGQYAFGTGKLKDKIPYDICTSTGVASDGFIGRYARNGRLYIELNVTDNKKKQFIKTNTVVLRQK